MITYEGFKLPKITIFIPTFRRSQLLKKAIYSALNQTWRDLQVIVCDNASKDQTGNIVRAIQKRDKRVKYICHDRNIGMLANYQFALSILETPFYSFLSDDDVLLPNFCMDAMDAFSKYPDMGFFAGSTIIACKELGILRVPMDLWPREGVYEKGRFVSTMVNRYPAPTAVLFHKVAEIDFQNQPAWDCDYLLQLAAEFPFFISKKPCGIMLHHNGSYTAHQSYERTKNSVLRLVRRVEELPVRDARRAALNALQDHLNKINFYSVMSLLANRNAKEAWNCSQTFFCKAISLFCRAFPVFCFLFSFLKTCQCKKRRLLFKKYEQYLRFL
jgi:glycosyltransferase involved in cell wall biosynthesis